MSTPLTDSINALTAYANEVTGQSDTTLSDAVGTLVAGYGGGGSGTSSWTKVAETSYQITYSATNSATHAIWETGHSEIWTPDKIVYVRIRDTEGKRTGYFYGTDTFFMNFSAKNHPTYSNVSENIGSMKNIWACDTNGAYTYRYGYGSTGYGVYPVDFYDDGRISICKRYNSSYSRTIDGTYKVEVYLLDPAGGVPIFE